MTLFTSGPFQDCVAAKARQQADDALVGLQKELDAELDRLQGQIDAFIEQVKAKRGKPIDPEVADDLIEQAEAAKAGL